MISHADGEHSVFSLSESLARGLVARMVPEWSEQDKCYLASKDRTGKWCLRCLPGKRALGYRGLRERTKGLVPPGQIVLESGHGKQDGLDKTAGYAVIHWYAQAQMQHMDLLMTYIRPGWRFPRCWDFLQVSAHALISTFTDVGRQIEYAGLVSFCSKICSSLQQKVDMKFPTSRTCYSLLSFLVPLALPSIVKAQNEEVVPQSVTVASTRDPQWMSYRKAHYTLEWLESYSKPKNFIRLTFQLWPKDLNESTEGVQLELVGEKTRMVLSFEPGLHVIIPKLKEAYEEDAEFRINRRAGTYFFQNTGSIKLNANGVYPVKELRVACNQLLSVLRDGSIKYRLQYIGKDCKGIEFSYPKTIGDPSIFFRDSEGKLTKLDKLITNTKRSEVEIVYKFPIEADAGEIVTETPPLLIGGLFE